MRLFLFLILFFTVSVSAKADESFWRFLGDGFWGTKSCELNYLTKFGKSGYVIYKNGEEIHKGRMEKLDPFIVPVDNIIKFLMAYIENDKWYGGVGIIDPKNLNEFSILKGGDDMHPLFEKTYYRCKNISQQMFANYAENKKNKKEERDKKYAEIVGNPIEYLQGKWAFTKDGCNGDLKTVFIGNKSYGEMNGKPFPGVDPVPFTVKRDVSRLVVKSGKFDERALASAKWTFLIKSKNRMEMAASAIVLASGLQEDLSPRMMERC